MSTLFNDEDFVSVATSYVADISESFFDFSTVRSSIVFHFDPWPLFITLRPVAVLYVLITAACLQIYCVFFNSLVFIYYRKINDITRPYILSLIALDLLLGIVTLTSFVIVLCSNAFTNFVEIVYDVFYISFVFGFASYLYPSLFLACDRFLVVLYPLKFKDYIGKMRVAKFVWISIHLINQISLSLFRFIFGVGNILYKVTSAVSTLFIIVVTLGTCFLYVIMIVKIIRSSRKIAKSRARRSTSK